MDFIDKHARRTAVGEEKKLRTVFQNRLADVFQIGFVDERKRPREFECMGPCTFPEKLSGCVVPIRVKMKRFRAETLYICDRFFHCRCKIVVNAGKIRLLEID